MTPLLSAKACLKGYEERSVGSSACATRTSRTVTKLQGH